MTSEPAMMETMSGAPVLVVVFGGVLHGVGIDVPPFEFLRSLSSHKCDAIFLRDFRQAWYQLGVEGIAADVAGLAHWLRTRRRGYARTITLGNSMGGFAALLFGRLAGFDLSLAFSPQTTIEAEALAALGDRRWQKLIKRVHAQVADSRHFDVLSVVPADIALGKRRFIFFGADSAQDAAHAMRLAGARDSHLFAVRHPDHKVIRLLRDSGTLARLIGMACDPDLEIAAILDDLRAGHELTRPQC